MARPLRNSWGSDFGEDGHFKFVRGENAGGIEFQAVWLSPDVGKMVRSPEYRSFVVGAGGALGK